MREILIFTHFCYLMNEILSICRNHKCRKEADVNFRCDKILYFSTEKNKSLPFAQSYYISTDLLQKYSNQV